MKLRLLIAAAALAMTALVHAQTLQVQTGTSPVIEVQRLAPQLVAFAGGEVNFANLVNGLALGLPVTLTTPVGAGVTQAGPAAVMQAGNAAAAAAAGGSTVRNTSDSLFPRGISDTPPTPVPGVTTTPAAPAAPTTAAPITPAPLAPPPTAPFGATR